MRMLLPAMFALLLAVPAEARSPMEIARAHRAAHEAQILAEFADLLRIPNVSSDLPNVRRNAEWIRDAFSKRGATMELLQLNDAAGNPDGPPIVYGRIDAKGAKRTLGIYVHYDGQPVDASEWLQSPWEPTLYDGMAEDGAAKLPFPAPGERMNPDARIYARGSGDDRAPLMALLAALDALNAKNVKPTSNLVFMFEGEEEIGSPHLERVLETWKQKLQVDAWLICDGPVHQSRRPQLVFGVRGVTSMEITVYGPERGLHSGHYGNWAPNPAMELAQLLASMKDADGQVLVEGFYDSVAPLGDADRAALAGVPRVDDALMKEFALGHTEGNGAPLAERLLLPSLNVRGLASGGVGERARNVIPATASASLDIRLVKGNDPEHMLDLVEAHVRAQGWHVVRETPDDATRLAHTRVAKIERGIGYLAARTSMDHPIARALAAAAGKAAGEPVVMMPSLGGSLPLYLFTNPPERPVIIVPIANHDNNQHAPNENLRLANLWYGIDLMAAVLTMR